MRKKSFCKAGPRHIRRYAEDLMSAEPRRDLRTIIDKMLRDEPTSTTIRQHAPIEPDGDNPDDFDSGTREIVDLVDQQHLEDDIKAYTSAIQDAKLKEQQQQQQQAFDKAVADEVERRSQQQE